MKKSYVAEFIGTYLLATAVLGASTSEVVPVPFVAAATLAIVVYLIGQISGAHINPAITISLFTSRKISAVDAGMYLIFQLCAGVFAALTAWYLFGAWSAPVTEHGDIILVAETIGTFVLAFGVHAVVKGVIPSNLSGLVIGGSLFIGINIALLGSGAVLNPAVAVALKADTFPYLLGPVIGAILAGTVANYIFKETPQA